MRRIATPGARGHALATLLLGGLLIYVGYKLFGWAVVHAVWSVPDAVGAAPCREVRGVGACWAVIHERARFILMGGYPYDQQWRPALACLLFIALYAGSTIRAWWGRWLVLSWIVVPAAILVLLHGGIFGLAVVTSEDWGGLPLTFVLSTVGFVAAFPLAVALALARASTLPALRALSIAYVEIVRGVPFITFLFMASVMFPLFLPPGITVAKLARAQLAFVMFIVAYLAEVIRAGLASVPKGQYEAATSLGLTFWPTTVLIVLPQALRVAIPALVNTFIGFFKDTSLVMVIGMFDLLGAGKAALADARWVGFGVEVYLFVAAVYFVFCYAVSRYSQHLETALRLQGQR